MIKPIVYLLLGIALLVYFILTVFMKKDKLILFKNRYLNILTIIFNLLFVILSIAIGIVLTFSLNDILYLYLKLIFENLIFLYVCMLLVINVIINIKNKKNVINKTNIIILCFVLIFTYQVIVNNTTTTVTYDEVRDEVVIKDFLYSKRFKTEDIKELAINETMPYTKYDILAVNNYAVFKGLFKTNDNKLVRIMNNLDSEIMLTFILDDNKNIYYVGATKEFAYEFYEIIRERILYYNNLNASAINVQSIEYDSMNKEGYEGLTDYQKESLDEFLKEHPEIDINDLVFK